MVDTYISATHHYMEDAIRVFALYDHLAPLREEIIRRVCMAEIETDQRAEVFEIPCTFLRLGKHTEEYLGASTAE